MSEPFGNYAAPRVGVPGRWPSRARFTGFFPKEIFRTVSSKVDRMPRRSASWKPTSGPSRE